MIQGDGDDYFIRSMEMMFELFVQFVSLNRKWHVFKKMSEKIASDLMLKTLKAFD